MADRLVSIRSLGLIVYTLAITLLCVFVFTGNALIDTVAFLALLAPLFVASDFDKVDPRVGVPVLAFVLLCALPIVGMHNTFYLDVAIQVGIFAVLALGLNIVVGFAGLLDLGRAELRSSTMLAFKACENGGASLGILLNLLLVQHNAWHSLARRMRGEHSLRSLSNVCLD